MTDTVLFKRYNESTKRKVSEAMVAMEELKKDKIDRVLGIYTKLMNGYLVNKVEEAQNYGVNGKRISHAAGSTIQIYE